MNIRKIAAFILLCVAALFTVGCGNKSEGDVMTEVTMPPVSDEYQITDTVGEPVGQEPETGGVKLNSDELKALDKMLFEGRHKGNWYYRSIAVQWSDDPRNIDLSKLFYNGFDGECNNLTEDEVYYLSSVTGISERDIHDMGQFRLPQSKMDYVLREYYGISLDDSNRIGLDKAIYRSDTGCYYMLHDDEICASFGLHSAYEQENGGFIIYYGADENSPAPEYVMAVEPNDFGSYTVLYNKPVAEE